MAAVNAIHPSALNAFVAKKLWIRLRIKAKMTLATANV
jgi:hypothetical protein